MWIFYIRAFTLFWIIWIEYTEFVRNEWHSFNHGENMTREKKYDKIISISCNVRLVQRKSDIRTVKRSFPQNFIHGIEIITPFQIRVHINVAIDIIHILKCICSHNIFITVYRTLLCVTNLICHAGHMSRSRFVETSINYATSCRLTRRNKK